MGRFPFPARMSAEMVNPLQSFRIDFPPWGVRDPQVLELGLGGRRVLFGSNVRPRLEIPPEHAEIELSEHKGQVLFALRLTAWSGEETRFVTAGADRKVVIWDLHGNVIFSMSEHLARVGALWELTDKRLATWSEDRVLIVWNTSTGRMISRIPTRCPSHRICVDPSGDYFCLSEYWRARIVDIDGIERATLKWEFAPIVAARRLRYSGRWITRARDGQTKLWSNRGHLHARMVRSFSFEDGYLEFKPPSEQLLIIDDAHYLELFDRQGVKAGGREKDEGLARDLRGFLRSRTHAREAIHARTSYQQFERRVNPLSPPSSNTAAAPAPADVAADEPRKSLLNFFQRPDFRAIRSWLRDDLEAASRARESVEAALHEDRTHKTWLSMVQGFVIALGAVALWFLPQSQKDAQFVLGLVVAVATVTFMWAQLRVFAMVAAERALVALPREMERLVSRVQAHRRRIIAGIPASCAQAIHAADDVLQHISDMIADELTEAALRACAVWRTDLLNEDGDPFALCDWAALAQRERTTGDALSTRNLNSFWWTEDGRFVFAVHTIQFVLLNDTRVDIYTLDYDFIAGRSYNETLLTIYYSDVTDVLQRRVSRTISLEGVTANIEAAEVVLVLRSGGSVSLKALDDGASELREAVRQRTAASIEDHLRNLDTEEVTRPRSVDYSQDAVAIERDFLRAELAALRAPSPRVTDVSGLDGMIACIKRQVLLHKDPPAA